MKKILLTGLALGFSILSYSQDQTGVETKTERIKLVKAGEPVSSSKTKEKKLTPAEELEKCEKKLIALKSKEEYIRGNEEELNLAIENGWFEEAAKTRAKLNQRIAELKLELNK